MNYKKLSRIADSSSRELGIEPFVATLLRLKNEFFESFPDVAEAADNGDVYVNLDVENINRFEITLRYNLMPSAVNMGENTFDESSYNPDIASQLEDHLYEMGFGDTINVVSCKLTIVDPSSDEVLYSNYDTIYDVFPDSADTITLPN